MITVMIGALVVTFTCAEPHQTFRQFYAEHYFTQATGNWAGARYEETTHVQQRVADATADFVDYIVAYHEVCK